MDKSCPICLDIIGETNCCITACNHSFCLSCLSISLQNNISCPLCRNELVPESKAITELKDELDNAFEETSFILDILDDEREETSRILDILNKEREKDKERIPLIDIFLNDGQIWKDEMFEFKVIHVPGHTSGHICFYFFSL